MSNFPKLAIKNSDQTYDHQEFTLHEVDVILFLLNSSSVSGNSATKLKINRFLESYRDQIVTHISELENDARLLKGA